MDYQFINFTEKTVMTRGLFRVFIFSIFFISLLNEANTQDLPKCRTYDAIDILLMKYPHLRPEVEHAETELEEFTQDYVAARSGGGGDQEIYLIPVVFHIIHDGGIENISDEQVHDAMRILNRDFALENEDVEDVVEEFSDLPADIGVKFRLAQRDPFGNCTNGIIRVESPLTDEGGSEMKSLSIWPRDEYLNVWVCRDAGGAAGYTFVPSSVNGNFGLSNDGIVLLHNYTGSIGTSNENRSRTLTHEVGHWINLRHLWGPTNEPGLASNCDVDDGVNDTPFSVGWTSCVLAGESCGSLDNVQNYMEYSYCSNMFTEGQRLRMRAALNSGTADRNELWQQSNLEATGVLEDPILCFADFRSDLTSTCTGTEIQFEDLSYNEPSNWEWNFGDGTQISGADLAEPVHIYEEPGEYTVTLTVTDGESEISVTKEQFISVQPSNFLGVPFEESFEEQIDLITDGDKWTTVGEDATENWRLYDGGGFTGDQCVRIRNNNNVIDDEDDLISSTMDFTGATEILINYKWAFVTKEEETDDRLRVYISNDCGLTWQQRKLHRGFTDLPSAEARNNQFAPTSQDEWNENTIVVDNDDYFGPSFMVRFNFQNFGGNNLYLDDINIGTSEQLSTDEISVFNDLSLYPNPSDGNSVLSIQSWKNLDLVSIQVVDTRGRTIQTVHEGRLTKGTNTFNLGDGKLETGLYFIQVWSNEETEIVKWIVNP